MSGDEEDSGEEFESDTSDTIYQTANDDTEDLTSGTLENKLKNWISRNVAVLTHKSIDEILVILRSEGYTRLPKSAKTLLGTSSIATDTRIMKCSDDTIGHFKYFGIYENLNTIIDPGCYLLNELQLIIHVDGMDLFNKSKKGFWSIMGKVFSNSYISKPFLIALFFGNSKPYSAGDFFKEFISEANDLTKEGNKLLNI